MAATGLLLALCSHAAEKPLVGAIRWDGWQENGDVQAGLEKALGPNHWHYRLPFFAQVTSSNTVSINGNSQAIMDREINYAADGGIDYWSFDIYPDDIGMSNALHLYLKSGFKHRINFVLNLQGGWIAEKQESWDAQMGRFVRYFKDPSYQKVLGNHPLVFLFTPVPSTPEFPDNAAVAAAFKQLRAATINAGLGNPYIVYQGWVAIDDFKTMQDYGLDAIGAYAVGGGRSYASLAEHARQFWEQEKATGANVVPIVGSGWDNRPFQETPTSWYPEPIGEYTLPPTPAELAGHLADALDWTQSNLAKTTPANTVLIYGWNENAEGGWLVPTLNPDGSANTERIDAIEKKLKNVTDKK
ncbi:MAG: glycoside hydrolase family 99-like domain-containing protein [Kiritimatiellales bacterium]|nr:glycoside hydrolase family 99-like domain-containing protein [Kiritimatiellales bacterium]